MNRPTQSQRFSRYGAIRPHVKLTNEGGTSYQQIWRPPSITAHETDKYHTVEAQEASRLDLVAYRYYGTASLWWVIALASGIDDQFFVRAGDRVRIPDARRVASLLQG